MSDRPQMISESGACIMWRVLGMATDEAYAPSWTEIVDEVKEQHNELERLRYASNRPMPFEQRVAVSDAIMSRSQGKRENEARERWVRASLQQIVNIMPQSGKQDNE